jgi:Type IV Pilus-assembly protein W
MYGINDKSQLVEFDLLNFDGLGTNAGRIIAENVVDLRAIYGVNTGADTDGDSKITPTEWISPSTTAAYNTATLNTSTAGATWDKITAVRIAMVVRSAEPSRDDQNLPTSYAIFGGTPLETTVNIQTGATAYRHQVYETTIPIRNNRFVPAKRTP